MQILVFTLVLALLIEVAYDLGAPGGPPDLVGTRQTLACSKIKKIIIIYIYYIVGGLIN